VVLRSGSTDLIRNGSMMVFIHPECSAFGARRGGYGQLCTPG
jgi:hypothetical protein